MKSYSLFLFWFLSYCFPGSTLATKSQDLEVNNSQTPRVRVYLKPNGKRWDILGYGCDEKRCHKECNSNNSNDVSNIRTANCTYNCRCLQITYVSGVLPSNCKLTDRVECKNVCFQKICKELCKTEIVKECENISG